MDKPVYTKEQIIESVEVYWYQEDKCYVAESPLIPHVIIGTGKNDTFAISEFKRILNLFWLEFENGNVSGYEHYKRKEE